MAPPDRRAELLNLCVSWRNIPIAPKMPRQGFERNGLITTVDRARGIYVGVRATRGKMQETRD